MRASAPRIAPGIAVTQRPTAGKRPRAASMRAMIGPMRRLATPVIWITPIVLGEGRARKTAGKAGEDAGVGRRE